MKVRHLRYTIDRSLTGRARKGRKKIKKDRIMMIVDSGRNTHRNYTEREGGEGGEQKGRLVMIKDIGSKEVWRRTRQAELV